MLSVPSPTTSAPSRTTSATSGTLFLRFAHESNFFRSQVGRNLVVSRREWGFRSFEHGHDLAATGFALAITHDLCDQSYVLSTICQRFQHFSVAVRSYPSRKPGVTGALRVFININLYLQTLQADFSVSSFYEIAPHTNCYN